MQAIIFTKALILNIELVFYKIFLNKWSRRVAFLYLNIFHRNFISSLQFLEIISGGQDGDRHLAAEFPRHCSFQQSQSGTLLIPRKR